MVPHAPEQGPWVWRENSAEHLTQETSHVANGGTCGANEMDQGARSLHEGLDD